MPKRREIKRGPKPKDVLPFPGSKCSPPPKHLEPEARKHWLLLAKLLDAEGLGSPLYEFFMELYCSTWARWQQAQAEVNKPDFKMVIELPNGFKQVNPYFTIARDLEKMVRSMLADFGLTPQSRKKLGYQSPEETDPKWTDLD
jgi:P27 family predicted phage terminase small subunit